MTRTERQVTEMQAPAGVDRPLSIGDIVDRSITLVVRRWRTLFVLVLIEAIPIGIARAFFPVEKGALFLIWFIPDLLIVAFLSAAIVLTTLSTEVPPPRLVLQGAVRLFGRALGAWLLAALYFAWFFLVVFVGAAIVMIPVVIISGANPPTGLVLGMITGGVVSLAVLPRIFLICMMAVPNVVIDGVPASTALTLARRRVGNAGWKRSWLLGLAVIALVDAPPLVLAAALDTAVALTHVSALRVLEEFLTDIVSLGFATVLATVVALDLRVRSEGADIAATLDATPAVRV